jgi:hypothetical protein
MQKLFSDVCLYMVAGVYMLIPIHMNVHREAERQRQRIENEINKILEDKILLQHKQGRGCLGYKAPC